MFVVAERAILCDGARMGDKAESDDVGSPLFVFNQDKPTVDSLAGMKQMVRPLFRGAQVFREIFPMFGENPSECAVPHTEIGGRLCELFRQLGDLACKLERAGEEFIAIETLVKETTGTPENQPS